MAGLDKLMKDLARAAEDLASIDRKRETAMRRRDDALRAAHAAGATYVALRAATRMSPTTISKALNRR